MHKSTTALREARSVKIHRVKQARAREGKKRKHDVTLV